MTNQLKLLKHLKLAIIICTFNPEEKIFLRLLKSIENLQIEEGMEVECIIVDNNSAIPIIEMDYIKTFLKQCNWAKVIQETKQGLSFARLAGLKATTSPILVFFDDDNEPAPNYLKAVLNCFNTYPSVAVWGPGKVSVEFLAPVSDWFSQNFRVYFQEKNYPHIEYGCVSATWTHYYPIGTGQVIKRDVLEKYYTAVQTGELTATGRKGNSLSSAEDIQIVWEAIKMKFSVGISPELEINHLISQKKSNLNYIKKLRFGTASSYFPALVESFPSEKEILLKTHHSNLKIIICLLKITFGHILKQKYKLLLIDLASYIGVSVGTLKATGSKNQQWLYHLVKFLALE
jgi:glycosyltransferase involved in cell wall biosynthesis